MPRCWVRIGTREACTAPEPRFRALRRTTVFTLALLTIEFLDGFVYGAQEAAWPLIRTDPGLTYAQLGLLPSLPSVVSGLVEPFLGVLGDVWRRRVLVLGGGALFAPALLLTSLSRGFIVLLVSFLLFEWKVSVHGPPPPWGPPTYRSIAVARSHSADAPWPLGPRYLPSATCTQPKATLY